MSHGLVPGEIRRSVGEHFADRAVWLPGVVEGDIHVGFRANFVLASAADVVIDVQASADFRLWIDGETFVSGPFRYAAALPEFHRKLVRLEAGKHAIAVQATGGRLRNRVFADLPGFVWVMATIAGTPIELSWKARQLWEYASTGLRVSPLLGWMEWRDAALDPTWRVEEPSIDWTDARPVLKLRDLLGPSTPGVVSLPNWPVVTPLEIASGEFRETFTGYRWDDPAMQFVLADRSPTEDADGVWFLYDVGRIRIGALEFTAQVEEETYVTIAYGDRLSPDGSLAPVTGLATGPTRMIQHYHLRAGSERLEPLQSLGARYIELRVHSTRLVNVNDPQFRERDFLGQQVGSFTSGDALLDRIWLVGADTLRGNAEDALVDCIRERAEWIGDIVSSSIDLLGVAWGDLGLVHRALLHAAAGANDHGLVAGCGPGDLIYVGTYAAQWMAACLQVSEYTSDLALLRELEDSAAANIAELVRLVAPDGSNSLPWPFVDWGYEPAADAPDVAALCHVLLGVKAFIKWQVLLHGECHSEWETQSSRLERLIRAELSDSSRGIGYHAATMGFLVGALAAEVAAPIILEHFERGFPFDPDAPRLRDPGRVDPSTVTPYFTNFSMRVLFEAGETDAVLDLWRRGWGWMLDQGATTWWEVFDDRWSHSHFWGSAPTWQMSRYLLGVWPTFDPEIPTVEIRLYPGSLPHAEGRVALSAHTSIGVSWCRTATGIELVLDAQAPIAVRGSGRNRLLDAGHHVLALESIDGVCFR